MIIVSSLSHILNLPIYVNKGSNNKKLIEFLTRTDILNQLLDLILQVLTNIYNRNFLGDFRENHISKVIFIARGGFLLYRGGKQICN